MPSPFPGMDPYLERASLWPDVHQRLIVYAAEALQPKLRPRYLARLGERVEVAGFGTDYNPDVLVIHPPPRPLVTEGPAGVLVADDLMVDYTKPPPVTLYFEEMEWLRARLDEWRAATPSGPP